MIDDFNKLELYSLSKEEKSNLLFKELKELTLFHCDNCKEYKSILSVINFNEEQCVKLEDIPFLPVRIFKKLDMKSIPGDKIFKIMTSSGTTGGEASRIYLSRDNAVLQQKVLLRILGDFVGKKRLPMLVIDSKQVVKNRALFPARGATIIGLEFAAQKMFFALDDDMNLDEAVVSDFLEKYGDRDFIVFGFTFMVWKHFYDIIEERNLKYDFSNGVLITGGGWKKLQEKAVSREQFKLRGEKICGMKHYVDHYGMAEQSGSIYAECEYGHLHASVYSDIIIRNYKDFSPCDIGEPGIIQVLSVLPHSYPGHSILTEDEGVILGEDDCPCGRKGKYVSILGRIKSAELRGCSDTYADKFK